MKQLEESKTHELRMKKPKRRRESEGQNRSPPHTVAVPPKSFGPHPKSDSALNQPKSSGSSLSIKCCNYEPNSPFGDVARSFPDSDWRSFRARRVVGEKGTQARCAFPVGRP
ncbi:hypothetical protein NL676_014833 [Syzygium grande]|nr:hypothetical protein NL676_014833 [Syzygium grande]